MELFSFGFNAEGKVLFIWLIFFWGGGEGALKDIYLFKLCVFSSVLLLLLVLALAILIMII